MRRLTLLVLCAALLLGVGAGLAYWLVMAHRLEAGFQAWVAQKRQQGWSIRVGAVARSTWSPWVTLTIHDVEIAGGEPAIPGGVAWSAPLIVLRVDPFEPWRVWVLPQGLQSLRLPDGRMVALAADRLAAGLSGAGSTEDPLIIDLDSAGLRLETVEPAAGETVLTAEDLDLRVELGSNAAPGEKAVGFRFAATGLRLPAGIRWPLGRDVAVVTLEGSVTGPMPDPAAPRAVAAAWRDGGGSAEVQLQALTWGPLTATGSATLALDDQLQPMGAGNAHVVGYAAALDALGANGVLTHSAAKAAKALLSLMATAPSGREAPSVDVPLTLQLRTLSMRQIPLLLLPELDWPEP